MIAWWDEGTKSLWCFATVSSATFPRPRSLCMSPEPVRTVSARGARRWPTLKLGSPPVAPPGSVRDAMKSRAWLIYSCVFYWKTTAQWDVVYFPSSRGSNLGGLPILPICYATNMGTFRCQVSSIFCILDLRQFVTPMNIVEGGRGTIYIYVLLTVYWIEYPDWLIAKSSEAFQMTTPNCVDYFNFGGFSVVGLEDHLPNNLFLKGYFVRDNWSLSVNHGPRWITIYIVVFPWNIWKQCAEGWRIIKGWRLQVSSPFTAPKWR